MNQSLAKKKILRKIQYESDIAKLEDEIKAAREKLVEIENELKDKRNEITLQTEKIFNVQNSLSLNNERKILLHATKKDIQLILRN